MGRDVEEDTEAGEEGAVEVNDRAAVSNTLE